MNLIEKAKELCAINGLTDEQCREGISLLSQLVQKLEEAIQILRVIGDSKMLKISKQKLVSDSESLHFYCGECFEHRGLARDFLKKMEEK